MHTDSYIHIHYALQTKHKSKSLHRQPALGSEKDSLFAIKDINEKTALWENPIDSTLRVERGAYRQDLLWDTRQGL